MKLRKKLIEVALPLEKINEAASREKSIRHGHPSTLHLWWARRPLAAARAVIFSQMVDDPSSCPEIFPTEETQEAERQRLFRIIEDLVLWENTTNERVLNAARAEIWASWRRCCEDNRDDPRAAELFNPEKLPAFHDPFAGGGALPLEAQRLGLEAWASDLNPVAVTICKAMIEIPPKFAGRKPVGPIPPDEKQTSMTRDWPGATGLAEDVRRYGAWMRAEAEKRIGHLYPKIEITAEMAKERPDLKELVGKELTVIAWLWARTVKSPDPAFADVAVPLVSTFVLSSKPGKESYVEPIIEGKNYRFTVKLGKPPEGAKNGTKLSRGAFRCLVSGVPFGYKYIDDEANARRMSDRMLSIVADGDRRRVYLPPTLKMESIARSAAPSWKPDLPSRGTWASNAQGRRYGFRTFGDYFTPRQLVALDTFSDLVGEAKAKCSQDAAAAGMPDDGLGLEAGGAGASAYAEAVAVYLAFAVDRVAMTGNSLVRWNSTGEKAQHCFGRQALPMLWDFAEPNFEGKATGSLDAAAFYSSDPLRFMTRGAAGVAQQEDAASRHPDGYKIISTDPPYYDNVGYADLSDFFYVWLRRNLQTVLPRLYATVAVPKAAELVATPYRHGGREEADAFFLRGMSRVMRNLASHALPGFPVTIYYAFKQAETASSVGESNTGWETFLEAVIQSGLSITGTWPLRTEMRTRQVAMETNALASSIVLVCRKRDEAAPAATRREFIRELKSELPTALAHLQKSHIAPVDLQQAVIGPGMAIYSRYSNVLNASGERMTVGEALRLINETLDEVLAEQEGDFDSDTRWAVTWFEQFGFAEGDYGTAETLSKAKNTSISGMDRAKLLKASGGKVRLLKPDELDSGWTPEADTRHAVWETLHHLIRALEFNEGNEQKAAALAARLGSRTAAARNLADRLYRLCERKKRAQDALMYNTFGQSWPEIQRLADEMTRHPVQPQQTELSLGGAE